MTQYVLMSGQRVPSNSPGAPTPTPVTVAGRPTRARVTFQLNRPTEKFAQATLWVQTAITPYNYTQDVPLLVMTIGPTTPDNGVTRELPLNLAYDNFLFATLDIIDQSQRVAGSMTMFV